MFYFTDQNSNKTDQTNVTTHTHTHISLETMLDVLKDFRTSGNNSAVLSGTWRTEAGNYFL